MCFSIHLSFELANFLEDSPEKNGGKIELINYISSKKKKYALSTIFIKRKIVI